MRAVSFEIHTVDELRNQPDYINLISKRKSWFTSSCHSCESIYVPYFYIYNDDAHGFLFVFICPGLSHQNPMPERKVVNQKIVITFALISNRTHQQNFNHVLYTSHFIW